MTTISLRLDSVASMMTISLRLGFCGDDYNDLSASWVLWRRRRRSLCVVSFLCGGDNDVAGGGGELLMFSSDAAVRVSRNDNERGAISVFVLRAGVVMKVPTSSRDLSR